MIIKTSLAWPSELTSNVQHLWALSASRAQCWELWEHVVGATFLSHQGTFCWAAPPPPLSVKQCPLLFSSHPSAFLTWPTSSSVRGSGSSPAPGWAALHCCCQLSTLFSLKSQLLEGRNWISFYFPVRSPSLQHSRISQQVESDCVHKQPGTLSGRN